MLMGSSPTQQKSLLISDSDIGKLLPVFSGSMRLINSCSEMIGSGNTIHRSIGLPRRWNSNGAWRSLVPWSALSHMSPLLPPTGQLLFWRSLDKSTSIFFLHTDLEWTSILNLRVEQSPT